MADAIGPRVIRKIWMRVVWFIMLLWLLNYLDRVNIGFAALQMNQDLGFTATVYGFGAGLFFLPYAICELPSNLILHKVGARIWLARIMITWGIVSSCFAFLSGETMFYVLRFLIGMAEAGFVPGALYYLTYWLPTRHRAAAYAFGIGAAFLSSVIGAPLSGFVLSAMNSVGGLAGWRWMFLFEGVPAILLGVVTLFHLVDRPQQARWLRPDELDWLERELAADQAQTAQNAGTRVWWQDPRVWVLVLIQNFVGITSIGLILWLPLIIKGFGGLSTFQIGLLTAIPNVAGYITMQLLARHSDRTGERKFHMAIAAAIGGVAMIISANAPTNLLAFIAITVAAAGIFGYLGVFWVVPTTFLRGVGAAGGLAIIGGVGQIGSFLGPYMVGWLKDLTGSFTVSLSFLGAASLLQALIICASRIRRVEPHLVRPEPAAAPLPR